MTYILFYSDNSFSVRHLKKNNIEGFNLNNKKNNLVQSNDLLNGDSLVTPITLANQMNPFYNGNNQNKAPMGSVYQHYQNQYNNSHQEKNNIHENILIPSFDNNSNHIKSNNNASPIALANQMNYHPVDKNQSPIGSVYANYQLQNNIYSQDNNFNSMIPPMSNATDPHIVNSPIGYYNNASIENANLLQNNR